MEERCKLILSYLLSLHRLYFSAFGREVNFLSTREVTPRHGASSAGGQLSCNNLSSGKSVIDGLCLLLRGRHGEFISPASVSRRPDEGFVTSYRRPGGSKSSPAFYLTQRNISCCCREVMRKRCLDPIQSIGSALYWYRIGFKGGGAHVAALV